MKMVFRKLITALRFNFELFYEIDFRWLKASSPEGVICEYAQIHPLFSLLTIHFWKKIHFIIPVKR